MLSWGGCRWCPRRRKASRSSSGSSPRLSTSSWSTGNQNSKDPVSGRTRKLLPTEIQAIWSPILSLFRLWRGVTKRCRLSWLTNSTLVCEPKCRGRGWGELRELSHRVQLCTWISNKLWRSNSLPVFNLWVVVCELTRVCSFPARWNPGKQCYGSGSGRIRNLLPDTENESGSGQPGSGMNLKQNFSDKIHNFATICTIFFSSEKAVLI